MQKCIVSSMMCLWVTLGWGTICIGEQGPAPRGELRVVDTHPGNLASVTLHVFEHLLELDKDGKLVPRLATSWQWRNDRTLEVLDAQTVRFIFPEPEGA